MLKAFRARATPLPWRLRGLAPDGSVRCVGEPNASTRLSRETRERHSPDDHDATDEARPMGWPFWQAEAATEERPHTLQDPFFYVVLLWIAVAAIMLYGVVWFILFLLKECGLLKVRTFPKGYCPLDTAVPFVGRDSAGTRDVFEAHKVPADVDYVVQASVVSTRRRCSHASATESSSLRRPLSLVAASTRASEKTQPT